MNAEIVKGWLQSYTLMKPDNYGNYKYTASNDKEYRIKFQSTSVRFEVKVIHEATQYAQKTSEWIRLSSDYYKNIVITPENKLKIGTRLIKSII